MTTYQDIHRLASETVYHGLGIVPISSIDLRHDINRYLASLSPEDARRMRRKFRKLWRSAAKKPQKFVSDKHIKKLGLGTPEPTREQKLARKAEVSRRVSVDRVLPFKKIMLDTVKVEQTTSGSV